MDSSFSSLRFDDKKYRRKLNVKVISGWKNLKKKFYPTLKEDMTLNHIICKIIENIASTNTPSVKKFINNQSEVVNALWASYTHSSNNEQPRIASLNVT